MGSLDRVSKSWQWRFGIRPQLFEQSPQFVRNQAIPELRWPGRLVPPRTPSAGASARKLPYSLEILLENFLRHEDALSGTVGHIRAVPGWAPRATPAQEIANRPARVLNRTRSMTLPADARDRTAEAYGESRRPEQQLANREEGGRTSSSRAAGPVTSAGGPSVQPTGIGRSRGNSSRTLQAFL